MGGTSLKKNNRDREQKGVEKKKRVAKANAPSSDTLNKAA